jgi:hypothetical protein
MIKLRKTTDFEREVIDILRAYLGVMILTVAMIIGGIK